MNKTLTTAATHTHGARSYESPAVNVVEIFSEGVMCGSTRETSFEDWNTDKITW